MELLVEWHGPGATLTTGIDSAAEFVRITPGANWALEDVARFHDLQATINGVARSRYGILKIVMDLRGAHVVTAEVSDALAAGSHKIYGAADYVAVLTASALLKLQLRRAFNCCVVEIFTDPAEAEVWLANAPDGAEGMTQAVAARR